MRRLFKFFAQNYRLLALPLFLLFSRASLIWGLSHLLKSTLGIVVKLLGSPRKLFRLLLYLLNLLRYWRSSILHTELSKIFRELLILLLNCFIKFCSITRGWWYLLRQSFLLKHLLLIHLVGLLNTLHIGTITDIVRRQWHYMDILAIQNILVTLAIKAITNMLAIWVAILAILAIVSNASQTVYTARTTSWRRGLLRRGAIHFIHYH